jgi:disulfide bond formation protein DsbB
MSQSNDNQNQLANFTGMILTLSFIAVFALIASGSGGVGSPPEATPVRQQAVAEVMPTETPPPTATPLPPTVTPTAAPTLTATPQPSDTPAPTQPVAAQAVADSAAAGENASGASYDPALVARGETLYVQCMACHGPDARGIPNLGKNLVESEFVAAQTDAALVQFIITGRPIWDPLNTTGIDMPGKGGNPAMTTEDIEAIVAYLRTLSAQSSGQAEAAPVSNTATAYDPAVVAQGETLYMQCAACHGPDARGIPNLGKNLVESEFVAAQTDEALLAFIKVGRPIWDPENTTGIDMPGKGGNPALTDDNIRAIIAYLRTLSAQNQ